MGFASLYPSYELAATKLVSNGLGNKHRGE